VGTRPLSVGSTISLRKTPLFSQLFLCLSRASLGKTTVFIYEWRKSGVFRTEALPSPTLASCRPAPAPCRKTTCGQTPPFLSQLFLHLYRACLGKSICLRESGAKKPFPHRSRPNSFGGIGRRSNPRGVSARTSPGCFSTRSARSASGRHLVSSPAENAPFFSFS
jgi:hypothetical protein